MTQTASRPRRARIFLPLIAFVVLLAAYTVYWFYAAGQIERQARGWIAEQEAAGYQMDHGRMHVSGWPFRLSLRVHQPDVTAPAAEGGWNARWNTLAMTALPYDFNRWILAFDGPMVLTGRGGITRTLTADDARASFAFRDGRTDRIGVEIDNFLIQADDEAAPLVRRLGALRLNGAIAEDDSLSVRAEMTEISFAPGALGEDIQGAFGDFAERIRLDASLSSWEALAATVDPVLWAGEGGRMDIRASQVHWGPARLEGSGSLGLDAQRRPEGRIQLTVFDVEALIQALAASGTLSSDETTAMRLAAAIAPRSEGGIVLPFRASDGGIYLGPVRIADAGPLGGED
ncbi:DUF2125 domain-containing protein [Glycocaulis profundi]|nr:DUF2125 domain-containing protein [Glycocaulis profundi]